MTSYVILAILNDKQMAVHYNRENNNFFLSDTYNGAIILPGKSEIENEIATEIYLKYGVKCFYKKLDPYTGTVCHFPKKV